MNLQVSFVVSVCSVSKKFGEWFQKTNKTEDTNKLTLLAFKIIGILHNTLVAMFIKLLETVRKCLFMNQSQNRCHMFLDCRHVCKTCAFHDAFQAGKQKEVHPLYSSDLAPVGARSGEYGGLHAPVCVVSVIRGLMPPERKLEN
jgi:Fe-S-cluster containining protein